jgi:Uma2 family endonuclease
VSTKGKATIDDLYQVPGAAEVRSEGDYGPAAERAMAEKRADYFRAGTLVVWDVDLMAEEVVRVYRATDPANPTPYRHGDRAEAEPAVPGWGMAVDDLFPRGRRDLGTEWPASV